MGDIAGAVATSHAFALSDLRDWDEIRERNLASFHHRYGTEPPIRPEMESETKDELASRFGVVNEDAARTALSPRHLAPVRP